MFSKIILTCLLLTVNSSAFNTGKLNIYEISSRTECEANRVYQKDDVTCFCNEYGQWPHKNCSLVFNKRPSCEPDSYVQVNCNICRCSKTGSINKEFCTNHICSEDPLDKFILRRANGKSKCELNHWYVISSCRLCFCLTKDNLLCAPESLPAPQNLKIAKYNLTDCGTDWLRDINKLLSSVNPLRISNNDENNINQAYQANTESVENQAIVQIHGTPTDEILKNNHNLLNLNQNDIGNEKVNIARNDDRSDKNDLDNSSESNSEEKDAEAKKIMRMAGNTAMPLENYEENDSINSKENDKKESDNDDNKDSDDDDNKESDNDDKKESDNDDKEESDNEDKKESDNDNKKEFENDRIDSNNKQPARTKKESEEVDITNEVEPTKDANKYEPVDVKHDSDESLLKLNLPGMLGKVFNFGLRKSLVSINDADCEPGSTFTVKCNTCYCLTNGKMLCTEKICTKR